MSIGICIFLFNFLVIVKFGFIVHCQLLLLIWISFGFTIFRISSLHYIFECNSSELNILQVITSHGGAHIESGVFLCGVQGIYKFQVSLFTSYTERLFLEVFKNSDVVASIYAYGKRDLGSVTHAVILELERGDTVQVRTTGTYMVALTTGNDYNTFTGSEMGSLMLGE